MSTKISWADETWNPIVGCSKISVGCQNCYAERQSARLDRMGVKKYETVVYKGKWSNTLFADRTVFDKPLHWRKPRKIFVCSMSDLFHESVPFGWIEKVMGVIEQCPQHIFYVLTKRPHIMADYFNGLGKRFELSCLGNLYLGVTVENQDNAGRIADLIRTPAAQRFVSFEPLLERIQETPSALQMIDFAFIGCESGAKARLCKQNDITYTMRQCRTKGVKVHVKQIPLNGKCNKHIEQWPKEFQVREV